MVDAVERPRDQTTGMAKDWDINRKILYLFQFYDFNLSHSKTNLYKSVFIWKISNRVSDCL